MAVAGFRAVSTKAAASPICINRTDLLFRNAKKIKPIQGFEDVVVHGDKYGFTFIDGNGKESNLSVVEFAEILKRTPTYHGGNIRLISCDTGSDRSIAAQELANALKVTVKAPSDIAFVDFDGTITIGKSNKGKWIDFVPKE